MLLSKIKPDSHFNSTVTFSVYSAKIRHRLVFFKPFSRDPMAKFALTDAMLASGKVSPKGKHHRRFADKRGGNRVEGEAGRSPQS